MKEKGDLKALVIFIHGLGEHINRYNHVFDKFAADGIRVIGFDQRGHGKTWKKEGKLGMTGNLKTFLQDLEAVNASDHSTCPRFVMGHSMGGLFALYAAAYSEIPFVGVISSAPALLPGTPIPTIKYYAGKALSKLFRSPLVDNGLDLANLSRDPKVMENYKTDPLVHGMISLGLADDILSTGEKFCKADFCKIQIPILITHGTNDHLTCPKTSKEFFDKLTVKDKMYKSYEGYFHERKFLLIFSP